METRQLGYTMSNIAYMSAGREKARDPAWLVGHIEDLVRYRPSLEGYSVEEVLESMLIQTCLASIKVGLPSVSDFLL